MTGKLFIVVLVLSFQSCSFENSPDEEQLAHLYVDLLVTDETYSHDNDSLIIARDSLFEKYQLNENEYKIAIKDLGEEEKTWEDFFALAQEYLDTLKAREAAGKKIESEERINKTFK